MVINGKRDGEEARIKKTWITISSNSDKTNLLNNK